MGTIIAPKLDNEFTTFLYNTILNDLIPIFDNLIQRSDSNNFAINEMVY